MRVLVLGAGGQLGWELLRSRPEAFEVIGCDRAAVDFLSEESLERCVAESRADWIVNAAAYTGVDRAEAEEELAFQVNCRAVEILATLCNRYGIRLVHFSTDFVFNGKGVRPWLPEDRADPISVYGRSKLGGEDAVRTILGKSGLIIRTAWLYSSHGNNFVKTMLNRMAKMDVLKVVDDQIGTPTWAAVEKGLEGTFHWTDAGIASWYDFAVAVQEEALELGILDEDILLQPIGSKDYPTPAKRPFYSVLDKTSMIKASGIDPIHWRKQLRQMLQEMVL